MKVKLLSLEPRDEKHPDNVLAVGTVELTLDSGETLVITEYRIIENRRHGPNWVSPPVRFGPDSRIPVVLTSRKLQHEIEDLILGAYAKQQMAALEAAVKQADNTQQTGGAR